MTSDPTRKQMLVTSLWAAVAITLLFFLSGLPGWGWGFLVGAFLSLFSTFSFMVLIPLAFRPGASDAAKGLLLVFFYLKVPFYMGCLYLGLGGIKGISPLGTMCGMALVPAVLTARAVGTVVRESWQNRAARSRRAPAAEPAPRPVKSAHPATERA